MCISASLHQPLKASNRSNRIKTNKNQSLLLICHLKTQHHKFVRKTILRCKLLMKRNRKVNWTASTKPDLRLAITQEKHQIRRGDWWRQPNCIDKSWKCRIMIEIWSNFRIRQKSSQFLDPWHRLPPTLDHWPPRTSCKLHHKNSFANKYPPIKSQQPQHYVQPLPKNKVFSLFTTTQWDSKTMKRIFRPIKS